MPLVDRIFLQAWVPQLQSVGLVYRFLLRRGFIIPSSAAFGKIGDAYVREVALTPTEMTAARRLGADAVKVFPVSAVGGPPYIRSVLEPLAGLQVVVSGGIGVDDVQAYLAAGCAAVCLGSALIDADAVRQGDLQAVAEHARRTLARAGYS